jgi:hypothetical protein
MGKPAELGETVANAAPSVAEMRQHGDVRASSVQQTLTMKVAPE